MKNMTDWTYIMVQQIAAPDKQKPAAGNSRRSFDTLAEYAAYQGAPESAFVAAGWQIRPVMHPDPQTYQTRRALEYRTATGARWRFIDGSEGAKYTSPKGYERCWYGLQQAVAIAQQTGQPLIIANGEAGVVVGQFWGLAATAITGGETGTIPPALLDTLKAAYPSGRIIVAQDCDKRGRDAGPKLARALCDAGYEASAADLQLSDKGDLADFCKLHGNRAGELLPTLPTLALPEPKPIYQARESREAAHAGELDWEAERRLWWVDVVLPAVERTVTHRRREYFQCISPHHADKNPSARISTDKNPDGLYICTCSTKISRETVGEWLGLDFMTWWKDSRAHLYQRQPRRAADQKPRADANGKPIFEPYPQPDIAADVTGEARYIADLPIPAGDVLIIADTGTGKTEYAAAQHIETSITHRQALSAALSHRTDTENYIGLTPAQLQQIPRLNVVINSLHKCGNRRAGNVLLDEIQQQLTHLGGDTFTGSEAETAYNKLKATIVQADRVIAADAYAGPVALKFLKTMRPGLKVVVNTYARPRGPLVVWGNKGGMVANIWRLADENAGVVVVPTGSKELAKDLERVAIDRYGESAVMAIYQDVANEPNRRAFLQNINEQIGNYRVVIYSPTVGSGIDIQTSVRAVCGLFLAEPLPAPECHQMINRCRQTRETNVYIERKDGSRETNPDVIFTNAVKNAASTGHVAHFDSHGLPIVTPAQQELHWLLSEIEAADNASKNRLYDHFLTLARGYSSVTYTDADDKAALTVTTEQRELRKAEEKAHTLATPPVSSQEYRALIEAGLHRPEHVYGLRRWQIEKVSGQDISSVNYDLLHTSVSRAALYLLTDHVQGQLAALAQADRDEHASLPGKRHHYTRRKILLDDLIKRVFGANGLQAGVQLEAQHIHDTVTDFLKVSGEEFRRLFNRRADLSEKPVAMLRWLLHRLGLKLESYQVRDNYERRRVYRLERETLVVMLALTATCYARQIADRAALVSQNVDEVLPDIHDLSHDPPLATQQPAAAGAKWVAYPGFYELVRPKQGAFV